MIKIATTSSSLGLISVHTKYFEIKAVSFVVYIKVVPRYSPGLRSWNSSLQIQNLFYLYLTRAILGLKQRVMREKNVKACIIRPQIIENADNKGQLYNKT